MISNYFRYISLSILLLHCTGLQAKVVQDDWVQPREPDNTTVLTIGETFEIEWTTNLWSWFSTYAPNAVVTDVDLWITGYYQHQYQNLVASTINVNASTSSFWKVQLPADQLAATPWWVFRFIASGLEPSETSYQISSPGVYVQNAITTTSTTTSSTSTAASTVMASTSTSSTSSPTTSAAAIQTSVPTGASSATPSASNQPSGGLSAGAIAGIAVGGVIGAVILVGLGWFVARRKKSSQATDGFSSEKHTVDAQAGPPAYKGPSTSQAPYPELETQEPIQRWAELPGGTPYHH